MSEQGPAGCIVQLADGLCWKPPTSGLPICGSCLRTLLDETDPRRRRTLAAHPQLAAGVVHQLAEDPDDQVRAQIAARDDLDTATLNRLANPDRELSPVVWHAMASSPGGAAHAWELLGTDEATTLAILAANPLVDRDVLEQLARYPDPDVAWTASATLAGQPPGQVIVDRIRDALSFDGLPIAEPITPQTRPAPPTPPPVSDPTAMMAPPTTALPTAETPYATRPTVATPTVATPAVAAGTPPPPEFTPTFPSAAGGDDAAPGGNRNVVLLLGAVAVVAVVVIAVVLFTKGGSEDRTTTVEPGPASVAETSAPPTSKAPSTSVSTTTTPATTPVPTTTPPETTAAPTIPPTAAPTPAPPLAPVPQPPVTDGPISQNFTITPSSGRFCNSVKVTVNFSPSPGDVVITDATGAQIASWSGASGQTKTVALPRPTAVLNVRVTAIGSSISVSGSASGESC